MRSLFRFPDPVDEVAARLVAGGVVLLTAAYLATGWVWLLAVVAYGFVARVLTGPRLSPLGQLVTRVVVPRLGRAPRFTPGPPKRFAQGIGATLSVSALLAAVAGLPGLAWVLVAMITGAALLESALGFCLGCKIFALLMRLGVVPQSVCEACNDLSRRPGFSHTAG
jgi:hypothetical protein